MTAERDHFFICIPLTAGVLLAMMLSEHCFKSMDAAYGAAMVSFAITAFCVTAAYCDSKLRTEAPLWICSFFFCGALCFFEDRLLFFEGGNTALDAVRRSGAAVGTVIDSIPFTDEGSNALVKALVTGDRSSLSSRTMAAFRNAGAAHMLALSGMHLGIIYLIVRRCLAVMGNAPWARKAKGIAAIVLTGLYTLMCGAGPSLMRAWLFITLYEAGKILGRPQNAGRVLCTALALHLVFRPSDMAQPGFQLSYLAMTGIVFIWPHMRSWYSPAGGAGKSPGKKIWDLMSLSISCQLFTGPLSYIYFHNFPKFFMLTNLVGAPLLTLVMLCSVAALTMTAAGVPDCFIYTLLELPVKALNSLMETVSGLENFA